MCAGASASLYSYTTKTIIGSGFLWYCGEGFLVCCKQWRSDHVKLELIDVEQQLLLLKLLFHRKEVGGCGLYDHCNATEWINLSCCSLCCRDM